MNSFVEVLSVFYRGIWESDLYFSFFFLRLEGRIIGQEGLEKYKILGVFSFFNILIMRFQMFQRVFKVS